MDHSPQNVSISELTAETITSFRQTIDSMGIFKNTVYFSTETNILNFYMPQDCEIKAKVSLPSLDVLEWNIC